jgi:hypothetical protein
MPVETVRDYVDTLANELRFDAALARRVCAEVEDHLLEAAESRSEREAIANFGPPDEFAARLAAVSFLKQTRAAAGTAVIVVIAIFFLMRARIAWYAATHQHLASSLAATIDRYAFYLGLTAALTALVCGIAWKVFASHRTSERARLQRSFLLSTVTTVCVLILLASDAFVMAGRLSVLPWSFDSLIPLFAFLVELILAALLVANVRRIFASRRRAGA